MRQLATPLVCLGIVAGTATAAPTFNETVVHDTTTTVEIALDADTVLCSSADYGALFLKILIPELARLTLLDHQNTGAGAPCVAAGACYPGHMPEDIIDPAHPTETVDIIVKAVRLDEADAAAQTCTTSLIENVHVTIRGFEFFHSRSIALGSRPFADCVSSTAPVDDDDQPADRPADDPGVTPPPSAGCATTGDASSSLLVLMLGTLFAIRRRRAA